VIPATLPSHLRKNRIGQTNARTQVGTDSLAESLRNCRINGPGNVVRPVSTTKKADTQRLIANIWTRGVVGCERDSLLQPTACGCGDAEGFSVG